MYLNNSVLSNKLNQVIIVYRHQVNKYRKGTLGRAGTCRSKAAGLLAQRVDGIKGGSVRRELGEKGCRSVGTKSRDDRGQDPVSRPFLSLPGGLRSFRVLKLRGGRNTVCGHRTTITRPGYCLV